MNTPARRSRSFGIAALLLVNVFWGLSFIASKYALTAGFPPMTLATVRYLFAAAILTPLALVKERSLRLKRADLPVAVLSALVGITFYYFFEYTGMLYTTASTASLILATVPIFSLLHGVIFARARVRTAQWVSVFISLAGVFFVIAYGADGLSGGSLKGNLLIVCCCICWVAYIQVATKLRGKYSSLRLTAWQALCALVTLVPFALSERARWVPVGVGAWLCALGLAAICSALCYFLYAEALSILDSFTVSLFININPIAAVLGGMLLLGEHLGALQLLGGALIVGSLLLNNGLPKRYGKAKSEAKSQSGVDNRS